VRRKVHAWGVSSFKASDMEELFRVPDTAERTTRRGLDIAVLLLIA
jgi:hypothetical protein